MKTTGSKQSQESGLQEEGALKELFIDELKDIYWAEKHLVKNMPKMAKAATSEELRTAFETHLQETEGQVNRLEQAFELLEKKAIGKKCEAMDGLVEEGKSIIEDTEDGTLTRDVGLISAAQKIEHYEIASYGTLRTLANVLGLTEVADLLNQTLEEEKKTDDLLTQIAEGFVNESAKNESK